MKKFDRIICGIVILSIIFIAFFNIQMVHMADHKDDNSYRVELSRLKTELSRFEQVNDKQVSSVDELSSFSHTEYKCVKQLTAYDKTETNMSELDSVIESGDDSHAIIATEQSYYKVYYERQPIKYAGIHISINIMLLAMTGVMLLILIYIRRNVIKPFHEIENLPYEIARGNLSKPLEESENRFLGKYIWGMNMLRENLEDSKRRELELLKEKKVLLMSISHDIKTPLSAIKLYASAIKRNLYKSEEKSREISNKINENADKIEEYISDIITASNQEFIEFDVECSDIYIKPVLEEIKDYYQEKMRLLQISFAVNIKNDCMVYGCHDRLIEVLQNIIENAIKYGDGKQITVDAHDEEEGYIISVTNSGCGLSEDELPHVFDSFFRGSNVGNNQGSGLGLYICRQIIHLMEAEIFAQIQRDEESAAMCIKIILRK